jgi:hemerythrin superfamily protein
MLKELMDKVMPGDGVIAMLKEDHRKVEHLFEQFQGASSRKEKTQIAEQALRELDVHTALEEELIYPAIRARIDNDKIMNEALEEHHVAHVLIEELRDLRPTDERYDAKFKVLAESVKHHVKEEESQVLPKAEDAEVDTPELQKKVLQRKQTLLQGKSRGTRSRRKSSPRKAQRGRQRRAA